MCNVMIILNTTTAPDTTRSDRQHPKNVYYSLEKSQYRALCVEEGTTLDTAPTPRTMQPLIHIKQHPPIHTQHPRCEIF
jgi:hypothetical protein